MVRIQEIQASPCSGYPLNSSLRRSIGKVINLLKVFTIVNLLLDLVKIDMGNCIITIKDTSNVLKGGTLGLDIEEINEDEFAQVPELKMCQRAFPQNVEKINLQCRTT
jgi:hypothetical protein